MELVKKILPTVLGFLLLAGSVFAVTISTNIPGSNPTSAGLGGIVDGFYRFALMLSGVLAFGAIVYGGIRYTLAAGNPSGQTEGKEWIKGALTGLLLLIGAYTILNIINPDLTKLNVPGLPPISASDINGGSTTVGSGSFCSPTNPGGSCATGYVCNNGICIQSIAGQQGTVYCNKTTSGQCPPGQTCVDKGDTLKHNYSCVANTTSFTCGGDPPNSHLGTCPPPNINNCHNINNGTTAATVRYGC